MSPTVTRQGAGMYNARHAPNTRLNTAYTTTAAHTGESTHTYPHRTDDRLDSQRDPKGESGSEEEENVKEGEAENAEEQQAVRVSNVGRDTETMPISNAIVDGDENDIDARSRER
jgi:hypothetical protein